MAKYLTNDYCPNGCGPSTEIRSGIGRLKVVSYRCAKCGYSWEPIKPYGGEWSGREIPGTSHASGYHE